MPYFSRALRLTALGNAMEPAIFQHLETLPLPADTPAGLADFLVPSPAIARGPNARSIAAIVQEHQHAPWGALSRLTGTALPEQDLCDTVAADWAQDARFLLRAFTTDLRNDFGHKRVAVHRQKALETVMIRYLDRAERIAPHTSAVYLALLWVRSRLHDKEIAVSTAIQYLNEIVIKGVLDYEGAVDLCDWDDEDVENARLLVLGRRKLADPTRKNRQDRLGQFLGFCQVCGLLEGATLTKETFTYALTKRRNHVVGLARFDQLQSTITHSAAREAALVNALLTMAFYGGLRSAEMLALSLNDIETCGPEIYLCIRSGKTAAARRTIPLHLIAPPRVCEQFREYLETRLAGRRCALRKHCAGLPVRLDSLRILVPRQRPGAHAGHGREPRRVFSLSKNPNPTHEPEVLLALKRMHRKIGRAQK